MEAEACAEALIERLSGHIRLALPLGLGKPALLANALYRQARRRPEVHLTIYTALTLEVPRGRSELEKRFLGPLVERLYAGVPELEYAADRRRGALPDNVRVEEFYLRPGAFLGVPGAQQSYASINYTHAPRDLLDRGVNVIGQMVAPAPEGQQGYSLSCNPDVTLDLLARARSHGVPVPLLVGEVNPSLPYLPGDAARPVGEFDMLIEGEAVNYPLFPVPSRPTALTDHVIALRVASLIKDGGTLQVGIGSLGDAIAHAIALRGADNGRYRALLQALDISEPAPELDDLPGGLYGASEMFVEGFLRLRDAGVLHRTVGGGIYLHGGFYLGSARFYERLRRLPDSERRGIAMTRISFTNNLLGDEADKRRQRRHGRFVNTAMMVTLLGAAVSDALEDGRVVSGVGGQYNFVAMAHELEDARSIIVLPATRTSGGKVSSNIVWNYGHATIPRHLRDVVVTEYGVADLRGATDQDVIAAMLNLADSRFQESLRERAVAAGKLPAGYRIPARYRSNTPEALAARLPRELAESLPVYPLGSDFTAEEAELAAALAVLSEQQGDRLALVRRAVAGRRHDLTEPRLAAALERMGLHRPRGLKERLYQAVLADALVRDVHDDPRPLFAGNGEKHHAADSQPESDSEAAGGPSSG